MYPFPALHTLTVTDILVMRSCEIWMHYSPVDVQTTLVEIIVKLWCSSSVIHGLTELIYWTYTCAKTWNKIEINADEHSKCLYLSCFSNTELFNRWEKVRLLAQIRLNSFRTFGFSGERQKTQRINHYYVAGTPEPAPGINSLKWSRRTR